MDKDIFSYKYVEMLFELLRHYETEDFKHAHKLNKLVRNIASQQAKNGPKEIEERLRFRELYKRSLLFDAEVDLDAYILYVEFDRPPIKKFYQPRRFVLKTVVQDLQDLYDRKIKLLAVSLPPRVGKSTLGMFFVSWIMGKHPELTSAMAGHSGTLTDGFYKEILGIIENDEYLWKDVFPNHSVGKKSAENTTIDIDKDTRFPTLTCRSAEGTWTGGIDCKLLLYCDDLIKDKEEALNPARLDSKFDLYANIMKDRTGDNVIELHVGTRWATRDPIGRLMELYEGNPLYRFRVIPALNENNESNFNYPYGVGFSTEYYLDMKKNIDHAFWCAKYMGEPFVREGLVFPKDDLQTFRKKEIPLGEPTIYMSCDVAWGGGDSLSSPIAYMYGEDVYIVDWIFNNGDKDETRPIVKAKIIEHKPHFIRFEANNGGEMYAESVEKDLRAANYRFNIESTTTTGGKNANKISEILAYAPDIKKFKFLDSEERTPEYNKAMKELCVFTQNGKVKHDDAPDSLKQLAKMILEGSGTYEIGERFF